MFRNVVIGSSGLGNSPDEWPELGDDKVKTHTESKKSFLVNNSPKSKSRVDNEEFKLLDAHEFPALSERFVRRPKVFPAQPPEVEITIKKPKKKKIKKSTPLQFDICDIIQASALKKKRKSDIVPLKKCSKIKRKVIGGNHLDGDQPKRHKGKVRPWKPRDLSKTKKIICASRKVRLTRPNYSKEMLRFKEHLGHSLKIGKIDVNELVEDLSQVRLDATPDGTYGDEAARKTAKNMMHNKKFRSYCNNLVTPDVKQRASELVTTLRKFQDRLHAKDEIKAHAKRRYVCGFNESRKFLLADKVKILLVASNLEMEEGLPSMDILKGLVDAAEERQIPVVYAGLGHNIGYWTLKKTKISVLAVMNYEGADDAHANLMKSWAAAKAEYDKLTECIVDLCTAKRSGLVSSEEVKKEVEDEIKETILNKLKEIMVIK